MYEPNPTVQTTHVWETEEEIPPQTMSAAEDKLDEVLAGDVTVSSDEVVFEAPTAVIPEAVIDAVHNLTGLDEDDTTYTYSN